MLVWTELFIQLLKKKFNKCRDWLTKYTDKESTIPNIATSSLHNISSSDALVLVWHMISTAIRMSGFFSQYIQPSLHLFENVISVFFFNKE